MQFRRAEEGRIEGPSKRTRRAPPIRRRRWLRSCRNSSSPIRPRLRSAPPGLRQAAYGRFCASKARLRSPWPSRYTPTPAFPGRSSHCSCSRRISQCSPISSGRGRAHSSTISPIPMPLRCRSRSRASSSAQPWPRRSRSYGSPTSASTACSATASNIKAALATRISAASAGALALGLRTGTTAMRVHAIQTGRVRIKASQVVGRGHGLQRRLAPLIDAEWSAWLPVIAYAIEHRDGVILVDSGAAAAVKRLPRWHPYFRLSVRFDIEPEQELGPQLRAIGLGPTDVRRDRADAPAYRPRRRACDVPDQRNSRQSGRTQARVAESPAGFAAVCPSVGRRISIRNRSSSTAAPMDRFSDRSVSPPTVPLSPSPRPATRPTTCRSSSRTETRSSSSPATPRTARGRC